MVEAVRLVIWDLDDTFWEGTVTEGGIKKYSQFNHDLVIELSKRGIMSSICSKNDYETIKKILTEKGIWEYFVFPSINWESKAHRVQEIIKNIQLRPESVVFIDDNHMNRAEVLDYIDGIRVEDENYISKIFNDPLYKGKNDSKFSRLMQYKILEQKQKDKTESSVDNKDFLRKSDIIVTIDHDVENNIDRVIELINRTNQLNFTKFRLSEDIDKAKQEILKQINDIPYGRTAGLVHVKDKYGDYGYCGFYLKEQIHNQSKLIHFCFSCRVLGMGVDAWLYQKLKSPDIIISGEVLTDIKNADLVDWINLETDSNKKEDKKINAKRIIFRGGCDLDAIAHYMNYDDTTIFSETNYVRNGQLIRRDSIINIIAGIEGFSEENERELTAVGLEKSDFSIEFLKNSDENDVVVLSLWAETGSLSYRNKKDNLTFMILFQGVYFNYTNVSDEDLYSTLDKLYGDDCKKEEYFQFIKNIHDNYNTVFYESEMFKNNLQRIIEKLHPKAKIIILKPSYKIRNDNGEIISHEIKLKNRYDIDDVVSKYKNVFSIDIMELLCADTEIVDVTHFGRMIYYKIYQKIVGIINL